MTDLREKIAREIAYHDGAQTVWDDHRDTADRILAIPEIADALLLMNTATRRYVEATRHTRQIACDWGSGNGLEIHASGYGATFRSNRAGIASF